MCRSLPDLRKVRFSQIDTFIDDEDTESDTNSGHLAQERVQEEPLKGKFFLSIFTFIVFNEITFLFIFKPIPTKNHKIKFVQYDFTFPENLHERRLKKVGILKA